MKKKIVIIFVLLLLVFVPLYVFNDDVQPFEGKALDQKLSLQSFDGKWYINLTTFPMWLKGNKSSPSFNYSTGERNSLPGLNGDVQYFSKKGDLKHIKGFSKPTNENNTAFLWRGTGLLRAVKSEWQIIAWNADSEWAIMHFEQTTFSPEGYDVFSRKKDLSAATLADIRKKLDELGVEDQLQVVKQE